MSVSILWKLVKDDGHRVTGTSNDWSVFEEVFGSRPLEGKDVEKLVAMHKATGLKQSLWSDLAEAINDLPEGAEIEVWAEW